MICQVCGKKDAVLKITKIKDGAAEEMHTCSECAANVSPYHAKLARKRREDKLSVENLIKQMLQESEEKAGSLASEAGALVPVSDESDGCPTCGLEFLRYKQTFMLGCADCYDAFGDRLLADLRKIHGATQHVGEKYIEAPALIDNQAKLRALRVQLEESLDAEDFGRAVRLRDEIRSLEESMAAAPGEVS